MSNRISSMLALFVLISLMCLSAFAAPGAVRSFTRQPNGILVDLGGPALKLQVCSDAIVHVVYSPTGKFSERPDYLVVHPCPAQSSFQVAEEKGAEDKDAVVVSTAALKASVNKGTGMILFQDRTGKTLFQEFTREAVPTTVNGEQAYRVTLGRMMFESKEAVYGLGQHQAGVWNYRGESVDLSQDNTNISVPLLVSSNGYGIFWNTSARSRMNNRFVHAMYFSAEIADEIDYYFLFGPELDQVIAHYRELTGTAPMYGKWAYGYWQCKNRYQSQQELLGIARNYRELHIPIDNIVQDWFWWGKNGDMTFNKEYPDPKTMTDELHQRNFHVMISVWALFDPPSANYDEVQRRFSIARFNNIWQHDTLLYDATNPEARQWYWGQINKSLFSRGFDAFWLDSSEPETMFVEDNAMTHAQLAIGNGARYANLFPLMHSQGVYQGQRSTTDQKRVFILTRSAYAGMQRNAASVWSGDIHPTWETFRRQIPAGLNYSLSGLPYWTTDIGGFTEGDPKDPAYRELYVRWFEYGTFCPIFRAHGTRPENEIWSYGPDAQKILTSYDRLRYRLMPYIYSIASKTTAEHYTPMRPLVMEFRDDERAQNTGDQFLFGPALMVSPVTERAATSRHLYLPKTKWYDFWTGEAIEGGRAIDTAAPLDRIPLHVRAGSIVAMGPELEWASQKPADPIELRVYPGANGTFTLYDDDGVTYDYEKGASASIYIRWDEASQTLTFGERKGSFPGMLNERTFHIVWVKANRGTGEEQTSKPDEIVKYAGKALEVKRH